MCGCFAYMHVFTYYVCAGLTGAGKRVSEPLELESEAVVSHHVCAGDMPRSSGRGLTHWAISVVHSGNLFKEENQSCVERLLLLKATFPEQLISPNRMCSVNVCLSPHSD